jgi:hypothetical protein
VALRQWLSPNLPLSRSVVSSNDQDCQFGQILKNVRSHQCRMFRQAKSARILCLLKAHQRSFRVILAQRQLPRGKAVNPRDEFLKPWHGRPLSLRAVVQIGQDTLIWIAANGLFC